MIRRCLLLLCLAWPLVASSVSAQSRPTSPPPALLSEADNGIREVQASSRSLITLTTKLRYTTMILLPEGEEILEVVCGDRDFWVIEFTQNIAHVKPAKAGAETNMNLITSSGAVYSFLLHEGKLIGMPDLKVYVTADPTTSSTKRKYYSAAQVDALQGELVEARASVDAERKRADEQIAAAKQQLPATMQFNYVPVKNEKPFLVRAIWSDGAFTYIQSDAKELPALYELKDGKPAIVNFEVHDGTYVVPKVVERGYLALGEKRLPFEQRR
jgi:type IV secretory pathway VirB9-like protein